MLTGIDPKWECWPNRYKQRLLTWNIGNFVKAMRSFSNKNWNVHSMNMGFLTWQKWDESQDLSVNNNGIYNEQKHEIFIDMWALKQQYGKCLRHRDEDCLWLLHCTLVKTLPLHPWRDWICSMTLETARGSFRDVTEISSGRRQHGQFVLYHFLSWPRRRLSAEMNMGMDDCYIQSHQGRRYETRKTK